MSQEIFNLKDEVLSIAAAKNHRWKDSEFNDPNSDENIDLYGKGNDKYYGHVRLAGTIDTAKSDSDGVSVGAFKDYMDNNTPNIVNTIGTNPVDENAILTKQASQQLIEQLIEQAQTELNTDDITYSYVDEEEATQQTTLTNKINTIDQKMQEIYNPDNIDLKHPKTIENNINIDTLIEPGYYYYDKEEDLSRLKYNDKPIHYQDSLIVVKGQPNGTILQYIYATQIQFDTNTNTNKYVLNGTKFLRIYDNGWSNLSLVFTPCQKACDVTINPDHEDTIITIKETTAGFIFNWQQANDNNNSYVIQEDLYEYEEIGQFSTLPIGNNPYIFSNLIGKVDVKITKQNIAIRSTLSKDSLIKNVNATFFVPRIE